MTASSAGGDRSADVGAWDDPAGGQLVAGPGGSRGVLPAWLVNLAALGWRVIAIAVFVVVLWELASLLWTVTASILVAVVISASFAPFALRLRERGRSRAVAAAIVWAIALGVISAALLLLAYALLPYLAPIVASVADGISTIRATFSDASIPPIAADVLEHIVNAVRDQLSAAASSIVSAATGVVTVMILAVFLVFFFLKDGDRAWVWIFQAVSDQKRDRIMDAGDDALSRVGGYLRGTTVLSAIIALTNYVFMLVLGVPLAGPLAVLVFFSGYIPYFGGIVTTALILLVTLATLGTGPVIVMVVLIAIRNAILSSFVRPTVYGRAVHIHPALVLIALPAGFQLAGVIGLFAAVPVTAVLFAVASAAVSLADPGPIPNLPALVPPWLDRVAQWSWRLLVAVAFGALAVAMLVAVPLVTIPIVFATIIGATLAPIVRALTARGQSRGRAAAIATAGTFLVVALIMVVTVISLVNQAGDLDLAIRSGADTANAAANGTLGVAVSAIAGGSRSLLATVLSVSSTIGSLVVGLLLSMLLTFYFLKDGPVLWEGLRAHVRSEAVEPVSGATTRAFEVLSGYMFGTGAVSLVGAGSQLFIMVVLGIPLALPIFVLSFFLCFIPYIGGFISTGLAVLVTIATGTPSDVAIMLVFTVVFNIVQGNIVAPLVYGKTVHLHPAIVLVAVPIGSTIAGMLGMFLVVPVFGVVATTWRTVLEIIGLPREPQPVAATAAGAPLAPDAALASDDDPPRADEVAAPAT
jgi:predicted PurR-regulated permease PerM